MMFIRSANLTIQLLIVIKTTTKLFDPTGEDIRVTSKRIRNNRLHVRLEPGVN